MMIYKLKRNRILLLLILLILSYSGGHTLDIVDTNAKVKALFIYSIGKYVEWPADLKKGEFKIVVYGNYPTLLQELTTISKEKLLGDQNIKIKQVDQLDQIDVCHMIYIDKKSSEILPQVINKTANSNTLILTDNEGLAKAGSGINFFYENSKQRMEINPENIEKRSLKISAQLLSLAKIVE